MSEAPERLLLELRQGMTFDAWSECRDPRYARSEPVEYIRADLSDALLREAMEALGGVMAACDHGRMVATTGVGGMTIEANIRGSVYMGVPAWPIEEARATLAKLRSHMGGNHE